MPQKSAWHVATFGICPALQTRCNVTRCHSMRHSTVNEARQMQSAPQLKRQVKRPHPPPPFPFHSAVASTAVSVCCLFLQQLLQRLLLLTAPLKANRRAFWVCNVFFHNQKKAVKEAWERGRRERGRERGKVIEIEERDREGEQASPTKPALSCAATQYPGTSDMCSQPLVQFGTCEANQKVCIVCCRKRVCPTRHGKCDST